jgi:hypothetical protein
MRIETMVNAFRDLDCNARLPSLDDLQAEAQPRCPIPRASIERRRLSH